MDKIVLRIEFERSWLLAHRNDFQERPIVYFTEKLESLDSNFLAVPLSVSSCEVFCDALLYDGEIAKDKVEKYIRQIFEITDLQLVAKVILEEKDDMEDNQGDDYDYDADFDAISKSFADILGDDDKSDEDDDLSTKDGEGDAFMESLLERIKGRTNSDRTNVNRGSGRDNSQKSANVGRRTGSTEQGYRANTKLVKIVNRINDMREKLSEKVKGQAHAIDAFVNTIFGMLVRIENG